MTKLYRALLRIGYAMMWPSCPIQHVAVGLSMSGLSKGESVRGVDSDRRLFGGVDFLSTVIGLKSTVGVHVPNAFPWSLAIKHGEAFGAMTRSDDSLGAMTR